MLKGDNIGFEPSLYLLTSNEGKIREISSLLSKSGINVKVIKGQKARALKTEIQANNLTIIVRKALNALMNKVPIPILIEDAGLFIQSLHGFPGPYSSYVFQTIGLDGILKLMEKKKIRKAKFKSIVGFYAPDLGIKIFEGIVEGEITKIIRGNNGFGFDPIFTPMNGNNKTFAEMDLEEKNCFSHRAKSINKFSTWFIKKI